MVYTFEKLYYNNKSLVKFYHGDELSWVKPTISPVPSPTPSLIDSTKINVLTLDDNLDRTGDIQYFSMLSDFTSFITSASNNDKYEVVFGDDTGLTEEELVFPFGGYGVNNRNVYKLTYPEGLTAIYSRNDVTTFGNLYNIRELIIPSTVTNIDYYPGSYYDSFSVYISAQLSSIIVKRAENSIPGSPWGATNATITWTG